jgi:hypothetical protein
MTLCAFPAALLLLLGVGGTACSDLTVGSSAQLFGATPANHVSPLGQSKRFDRVIPKFVQGGYFGPLAKPLPVLDKCGPAADSIVWDAGSAPAVTAPLDGRTNGQAR